VHVLAELRERCGHLSVRQAGRCDSTRTAEVDGAVHLVRRATIEKCLRETHDAADVLVGARLMLWSAYTQVGHVVVEVVLMDRGELVVWRPGLARRLGEHVVDVGDVTRDYGLEVGMAQRAHERIDPDEGGRVAEVRDVVRRHPAGVHAHWPDHGQGLAAEDEGRRRQQVVAHAPSLRISTPLLLPVWSLTGTS